MIKRRQIRLKIPIEIWKASNELRKKTDKPIRHHIREGLQGVYNTALIYPLATDCQKRGKRKTDTWEGREIKPTAVYLPNEEFELLERYCQYNNKTKQSVILETLYYQIIKHKIKID